MIACCSKSEPPSPIPAPEPTRPGPPTRSIAAARNVEWVGLDGKPLAAPKDCDGAPGIVDGDRVLVACGLKRNPPTAGFAVFEPTKGTARWGWPAPSDDPALIIHAFAVAPDRFGLVWNGKNRKLAAGVLGRDGWITAPRPLDTEGRDVQGAAFVDGALEVAISQGNFHQRLEIVRLGATANTLRTLGCGKPCVILIAYHDAKQGWRALAHNSLGPHVPERAKRDVAYYSEREARQQVPIPYGSLELSSRGVVNVAGDLSVSGTLEWAGPEGTKPVRLEPDGTFSPLPAPPAPTFARPWGSLAKVVDGQLRWSLDWMADDSRQPHIHTDFDGGQLVRDVKSDELWVGRDHRSMSPVANAPPGCSFDRLTPVIPDGKQGYFVMSSRCIVHLDSKLARID